MHQSSVSLATILLCGWMHVEAADPPKALAGEKSIADIAPTLPADVLMALQTTKFADAVAGLERLEKDARFSPDDRDYFTLLKGITLRRSGKLDEARTVLASALKRRPTGRWAAKFRGEAISVEIAARAFPAAESLARFAAESALADARKDRLAEVYLGFAEKLLKPESVNTAPDPAGAHALLEAGRGLAKGKVLRAKLLRRMALASFQAGQFPAAISENTLYLAENPQAADRPDARFELGNAQLAAGQPVEARRTYADLARDLATSGAGTTVLRAKALQKIAATHGLPNSPDDSQMTLGIASLKAAIEADPEGEIAIDSAYTIAVTYLARGKTEDARKTLAAFVTKYAIAEPAAKSDGYRKKWLETVPAASFRLGEVLFSQGKFDDSIAAFQGYVAKYGNGPQSADAQRAILEVQQRIAQDHALHERYSEARSVWESFVAKNPLDPAVPGILFLIGQSFATQKKYDEAIAAWENLATKFPNTASAASAQFAVADVFERQKGDLPAAIEKFKAVAVEPFHAEAITRIAIMERDELVVVTERVFRSTDTPKLKVRTRNLETLTFSAYKLDPEAYFRKKLALLDVEALDIGLVAPDAEWKVNVAGYAKFKPIEASYTLDVKLPGVYVVKVTDEKTLKATTLVVGSDIEAIIKTSRDQVLVFVQDMTTGKGRPDARVLLTTGEGVLVDARTGPDGVLLQKWAKPLDDSSGVSSLILDGPHAAGSLMNISDTVAQGLSPRAYLDTDRPAYRPGQAVEIRGVVREVQDGRYDARAGADYKLEVTDARGRPFFAKVIKLSPFGTFSQSIPLDQNAPVGDYKIRVFKPGGSDFSGTFAVQTYALRKVDLVFDLPRTVYYRGETIKGSLVAKYQYGTPLAQRAVTLALPDGRTISGETDASGKFAFELPTESFSEDQILSFRAVLPRDDVAASTAVRLAAHGFAISLASARKIYLDGETFPLALTTLDAQGKPIGQDLSVTVLKRVVEAATTAEREVSRREVKTDAKTGKSSTPLRIDDADGGEFVVRATGTDQFGNAIVADRVLQVSGKKDAAKLRILSDRTAFKVGEEVEVRLFNRGKAGPVLLTWEADRILSYRIVPLAEGENPLKWTVDDGQFPNVTLAASRMEANRFDQARLDATIERSLTVSIEPAKPQVGPDEEVEIVVKTADQNGKPVSAEVSLALVDEALLRLFQDSRPPIEQFFHDQTRTGAFSASATNIFVYEAESESVSKALVEADERDQAEKADGKQRVIVRRKSHMEPEYSGMTLSQSRYANPSTVDPFYQFYGFFQPEQNALGDASQSAPPSSYTTNPLVSSKGWFVSPQGRTDLQASFAEGSLAQITPLNRPSLVPYRSAPLIVGEDRGRSSGNNATSEEGVTKRKSSFAIPNPAIAVNAPAKPTPDGANRDYADLTTAIEDTSANGSAKQGGRNERFFAMDPQTGKPLTTVEDEAEVKKIVSLGAQGIPVGGFEPSPTNMGREKAELNAQGNVGGVEDAMKRVDENAKVAPGGKGINLDNNFAALSAKRNMTNGRLARNESRRSFIETAYWNPSVVTDKTGVARVKVRAPLALSRYRFSAKGVTGNDTLAGQSTAPLEVRKPFFVEMAVPPAFTQGDKPKFAVRVHHPNLAGDLDLKLTLYSGERETVIPRTIKAGESGVTDIAFDPFEVSGETLRIEAAAKLGELTDSISTEVAVRPWGVEAIASQSGSHRDDTTAIVGLPAGREYSEPEMTIVISPSVRGLLLERALDPSSHFTGFRCGTMPPNTTADRASDLAGVSAVLTYLRSTRAVGGPEAERLNSRARALVSELITQQNEDGGWSWIAGKPDAKKTSDRMATADVVTALATVEALGLVPDPKPLERGETYLAAEFAKSESGDTDVRAALLHALAVRRKAGFESANALNRVRQSLSDSALAHLALTFVALQRPELASEVLDVLTTRAKTENAGPGLPPRTFWNGTNRGQNVVETTALATLAFTKARPTDAKVQAGAEWLLAHREGSGWQPQRAQGTVLAALAEAFGSAEAADDRYKLRISVNDDDVKSLEIDGKSPNATIRVPRRFVKIGGENRVRFDVEGRGRYAYSVSLSGFTKEFAPDQDVKGKAFVIEERRVSPDTPEYDGRALSTGFSVAPTAKEFHNIATQVAAGGRVNVWIQARRLKTADGSQPRPEYLAIEEHLPAGASLVEGSIQTTASNFSVQDGVLTAYFDSDQEMLNLGYAVYGVLPGDYRVLPARVSSVYEPGRYHLGTIGGLKILDLGTKSTDPYRPTPDELYARGKALFDAGKRPEAAAHLEALWGGYALSDEVAKDAARMLFQIFLKNYNPGKVVIYFEVLKEKAPELVISFEDIKIVGRAYSDLGEHERAVLVWRAVTEASYLEDAAVGEILRQRGKHLESAAYLLDLWVETPDTPAVRADLFGLSQVLATLAVSATSDPAIRKELTSAGVKKSDLLGQAIRLDSMFLALAPDDPIADEASLALLGFSIDLKDYESVVALARRDAALYPKSRYLDSFQYAEALAQFQLSRFDRAIDVAQTIATASYKDADGIDQPSPNKWQALYILGQIHDARREPAKAISYYEQVRERFSDAADAVTSLTRKQLSLPEVSGMEPPRVSRRVDREIVAVASVPGESPPGDKAKPGVTLTYRNIAEVEIKVYPVDLMRLYLDHGNLDEVAKVDLAGITPKLRETVKLGDGQDFAVKTKRIDLPLDKEGAYLVIVRGESIYTSGIVLVSPLRLEILEDTESRRTRITVTDPNDGGFIPKAQVRVKGSGKPEFTTGETDLRGVYTAEATDGSITTVVRQGAGRYAFYREPAPVEPTEKDKTQQNEMQKTPQVQAPSLDQNLKSLNDSNRLRQMDRFEKRQKLGNPGGANAIMFR